MKQATFNKECMKICKYVKSGKFYDITKEFKSTIWIIDETGTEQPYVKNWVEETRNKPKSDNTQNLM